MPGQSLDNSVVRLPPICIVLFAALCSSSALAFSQLTPAQALIYENPHLANTRDGERIRYTYRSENAGGKPVEDTVLETITASSDDDERRDVSIDFLSGSRQLNLPEFPGYRGNPVIIAMLEHVARTLGAETGGGTLYFRNRIRDALAHHQITVDDTRIDYDGRKVDARRVEFKPFAGDSYLAGFPAIASSTFRLVFSDQVPGGVVSIAARSEQDGDHAFSSTLMIAPPE